MKRHLLFLGCFLSAHSLAIELPKDIKIFTQLSKASEIVDIASEKFKDTKVDLYVVDQKQDILNAINSLIPAEKFQLMSEDERLKWARDYISDLAPKKTLRIMKSTLGVSYMRLFEINKVPAILINNEFVTYGLSLSESLKQFERMSE